MAHFDPYNVFLAIATNIPQRLKTGFVVQGHIYFRLIFSGVSLFRPKTENAIFGR